MNSRNLEFETLICVISAEIEKSGYEISEVSRAQFKRANSSRETSEDPPMSLFKAAFTYRLIARPLLVTLKAAYKVTVTRPALYFHF